MFENVKPAVFASKCLGFAKCRYNGITIYDDFIEKLKPYVRYVSECPEVKIGLGVPRDPIRIILEKGANRLVQPSTKRDITDIMIKQSAEILDNLPAVDGFILKSRSPSCGVKDTKYYPRMEKSAALGKGPGLFGKAVLECFPELPVEDEGRIKNFKIREHFLTRIFTLARFRSLKKKMGELVEFHSAHKMLLMAYGQKELRILGSIVANHEKLSVDQVFSKYRKHLLNALLKPAQYTANINVLMHEYGYFSKKLSNQEKKLFTDSLKRYRNGKIPLSALLAVINAWIARFNETYLAKQIFFQPYPEDLIEITDSGKGRKLGK